MSEANGFLYAIDALRVLHALDMICCVAQYRSAQHAVIAMILHIFLMNPVTRTKSCIGQVQQTTPPLAFCYHHLTAWRDGLLRTR